MLICDIKDNPPEWCCLIACNINISKDEWNLTPMHVHYITTIYHCHYRYRGGICINNVV